MDIEDERLKDFDEIIWGRYFDPQHIVYKKIFIPFTPDNIQKMQGLYDEITDEMDAIHKWKELGYVMPAPKVIEKIKNNYNMSWSKFKNHIVNNF